MINSIIAATCWLGVAPVGASVDLTETVVNWAFLFLVTLAIELPAVMIAWRFRRCEGPLRPWLLASVVGNLISHPSATFLATMMPGPTDGPWGMAAYVMLETGSIAVEAWAFRLRVAESWTEAAVMALAANAVTAILGVYLLFFT